MIRHHEQPVAASEHRLDQPDLLLCRGPLRRQWDGVGNSGSRQHRLQVQPLPARHPLGSLAHRAQPGCHADMAARHRHAENVAGGNPVGNWPELAIVRATLAA